MIDEILTNWKKQSNERKKLQNVYVGLFLLGVVVAGLVSLLNESLGFIFLQVALLGFTIYAINVVIWALISLATVSIDESQRKKARRKKR